MVSIDSDRLRDKLRLSSVAPYRKKDIEKVLAEMEEEHRIQIVKVMRRRRQ